MEQQYILGRLCRDKVTLVEGVCVGTLDWLFGCRSYLAKIRVGKKITKDYFQDKELNIPEDCIEIIDPTPVVDIGDMPEEEPKFFGKLCRDKVTGYEGICIGRVWTYYSEKQYCLQDKYNKKKQTKSPTMWVDEGRVEVLDSEDDIKPEEVQSERRGGVNDVELPAI